MLAQLIEITKGCRKYYFNRDFTVDNKTNLSDYVTSADIAIENYLQEKLLELLPDSAFLGEENGQNTIDSEYLWVVDPIDGTSNFVRGLMYSGTSIALLHNNKPILGVIYNPYTNELFSAEKGKGAYLNGLQIYTSDNSFEQSLFCTAMSLYKKDLAKPCFNIIEEVYAQCDDIRRMGSAALELASLAVGRTDLYFEIRVQPWDFAAGELIIQEAGGYVGTIEYETTIFTRPIPLICANNKENFDRLMRIVSKELPKIPYEN